MTRQEAIQEQIDDIMDNFDFNAVRDWMVCSHWEWANMDGKCAVPDIYQIRREARQRLKDASITGFSCTGGFTARMVENVDESGPWVRLELSFGLSTINDGTTYTSKW